MAKDWRDPFTGKRYLSEQSCVAAVERLHSAQLESLGVSAKQACFNYRNRYPLGQKTGKSVLTGKPTAWNERAGRYERFCDEAEVDRYRQTFLERMRRVHGKDHLLNDPTQQRKMLANRRISGTYTFKTDSVSRTYTGQEELAFLQFMDDALSWPGADVHEAPQVFEYADADGKTRQYLPDFWIESLNLIVEIKGEQHSGLGWRTRDADLERRKDEVLGTSGYGYCKVEDRDYGTLLDAMVRVAR